MRFGLEIQGCGAGDIKPFIMGSTLAAALFWENSSFAV
jgi:hypothetical protein